MHGDKEDRSACAPLAYRAAQCRATAFCGDISLQPDPILCRTLFVLLLFMLHHNTHVRAPAR